jgi:hypothetical protein
MGIIDITGNKKNAWALLMSQEIKKKGMGFIDITGISCDINNIHPLFPVISIMPMLFFYFL